MLREEGWAKIGEIVWSAILRHLMGIFVPIREFRCFMFQSQRFRRLPLVHWQTGKFGFCATASESSEKQCLLSSRVKEHCLTEDGQAVAR